MYTRAITKINAAKWVYFILFLSYFLVEMWEIGYSCDEQKNGLVPTERVNTKLIVSYRSHACSTVLIRAALNGNKGCIAEATSARSRSEVTSDRDGKTEAALWSEPAIPPALETTLEPALPSALPPVVPPALPPAYLSFLHAAMMADPQRRAISILNTYALSRCVLCVRVRVRVSTELVMS